MEYVILDSEEKIQQVLTDHMNMYNDPLFSPLFHGTDLSLLFLDDSERSELNAACETIIRYMFSAYKENEITLTDSRLMRSRDEYGDSSSAYQKAESRLKNSRIYRFGDLFLSSHPGKAINFSKIAWIYGVTGWMAYRLVEGAKALGIKLPDTKEFSGSYELVLDRMEMLKTPVTLIFPDFPISKIIVEGEDAPIDREKDFALKIKQHGLSDSFYVKDKRFINKAFVIDDSHYDNLVSIWTNIQQQSHKT